MGIFTSWRRKTKAADKPAASSSVAEAAWVVEMHKYYTQNGFYRATDLVRLLGDPLKSVEVPAQPMPYAASQTKTS